MISLKKVVETWESYSTDKFFSFLFIFPSRCASLRPGKLVSCVLRRYQKWQTSLCTKIFPREKTCMKTCDAKKMLAK